MAGHGAARQMEPLGDLLAGHAVVAAQAGDHGEPGRGQLVGDQVWRRAAVLQAGIAFAAKRASHLRTVRVLTSNAVATAATLHPSSSTRRTITARPNGVVRAFLWVFIRVVLRQLVMGRTNHLPGFSPDEQRPSHVRSP